ncbi:Uma2 family endonuclease [Streptomyces leeuwenhoekii]|uniref:Uma2 family endonuclease n=1 Tax=Streptomyces leeuwenhoekii TaxID=1437453 RepID=UPI00369DB418
MSVAPKASTPIWPIPPEGGWTADDLDRLPNLPPHTELIDGSLVFVRPQTLAIEVVSADSVSRDRETKPLKYARAGIPHYWRVEHEKGIAAVHAFELEPTTGAYTSVGIFRERMKVSAPFPVDLDLTGIRPRRGGDR